MNAADPLRFCEKLKEENSNVQSKSNRQPRGGMPPNSVPSPVHGRTTQPTEESADARSCSEEGELADVGAVSSGWSTNLEFLQELLGQAAPFWVALVAAGKQEHERACGKTEHAQPAPHAFT